MPTRRELVACCLPQPRFGRPSVSCTSPPTHISARDATETELATRMIVLTLLVRSSVHHSRRWTRARRPSGTPVGDLGGHPGQLFSPVRDQRGFADGTLGSLDEFADAGLDFVAYTAKDQALAQKVELAVLDK